jgi:hypothetical protein
LSTQARISDLLFIAGKPPLVETEGRLSPFVIDTPNSLLTPQFTESLADQIIGDDERFVRLQLRNRGYRAVSG